MALSVQPYSIGCIPSPSAPTETLLQDGWTAFLLFFAVSESPLDTGFFDDKGVAVVECIACSMTKFGYPNDEGLAEHPLSRLGLGRHPVVEVKGSPWAAEIAEQKRQSAKRIWGPRKIEIPNIDERRTRHFVVRLKECTFECIASALEVRLYAKTFDEAYSYALHRFSEH